ncbi:hypothetical protein WDU94_011086 [Cyamophila willieti]
MDTENQNSYLSTIMKRTITKLRQLTTFQTPPQRENFETPSYSSIPRYFDVTVTSVEQSSSSEYYCSHESNYFYPTSDLKINDSSCDEDQPYYDVYRSETTPSSNSFCTRSENYSEYRTRRVCQQICSERTSYTSICSELLHPSSDRKISSTTNTDNTVIIELGDDDIEESIGDSTKSNGSDQWSNGSFDEYFCETCKPLKRVFKLLQHNYYRDWRPFFARVGTACEAPKLIYRPPACDTPTVPFREQRDKIRFTENKTQVISKAEISSSFKRHEMQERESDSSVVFQESTDASMPSEMGKGVKYQEAQMSTSFITESSQYQIIFESYSESTVRSTDNDIWESLSSSEKLARDIKKVIQNNPQFLIKVQRKRAHSCVSLLPSPRDEDFSRAQSSKFRGKHFSCSSPLITARTTPICRPAGPTVVSWCSHKTDMKPKSAFCEPEVNEIHTHETKTDSKETENVSKEEVVVNYDTEESVPRREIENSPDLETLHNQELKSEIGNNKITFKDIPTTSTVRENLEMFEKISAVLAMDRSSKTMRRHEIASGVRKLEKKDPETKNDVEEKSEKITALDKDILTSAKHDRNDTDYKENQIRIHLEKLFEGATEVKSLEKLCTIQEEKMARRQKLAKQTIKKGKLITVENNFHNINVDLFYPSIERQIPWAISLKPIAIVEKFREINLHFKIEPIRVKNIDIDAIVYAIVFNSRRSKLENTIVNETLDNLITFSVERVKSQSMVIKGEIKEYLSSKIPKAMSRLNRVSTSSTITPDERSHTDGKSMTIIDFCQNQNIMSNIENLSTEIINNQSMGEEELKNCTTITTNLLDEIMETREVLDGKNIVLNEIGTTIQINETASKSEKGKSVSLSRLKRASMSSTITPDEIVHTEGKSMTIIDFCEHLDKISNVEILATEMANDGLSENKQEVVNDCKIVRDLLDGIMESNELCEPMPLSQNSAFSKTIESEARMKNIAIENESVNLITFSDMKVKSEIKVTNEENNEVKVTNRKINESPSKLKTPSKLNRVSMSSAITSNETIHSDGKSMTIIDLCERQDKMPDIEISSEASFFGQKVDSEYNTVIDMLVDIMKSSRRSDDDNNLLNEDSPSTKTTTTMTKPETNKSVSKSKHISGIPLLKNSKNVSKFVDRIGKTTIVNDEDKLEIAQNKSELETKDFMIETNILGVSTTETRIDEVKYRISEAQFPILDGQRSREDLRFNLEKTNSLNVVFTAENIPPETPERHYSDVSTGLSEEISNTPLLMGSSTTILKINRKSTESVIALGDNDDSNGSQDNTDDEISFHGIDMINLMTYVLDNEDQESYNEPYEHTLETLSERTEHSNSFTLSDSGSPDKIITNQLMAKLSQLRKTLSHCVASYIQIFQNEFSFLDSLKTTSNNIMKEMNMQVPSNCFLFCMKEQLELKIENKIFIQTGDHCYVSRRYLENPGKQKADCGNKRKPVGLMDKLMAHMLQNHVGQADRSDIVRKKDPMDNEAESVHNHVSETTHRVDDVHGKDPICYSVTTDENKETVTSKENVKKVTNEEKEILMTETATNDKEEEEEVIKEQCVETEMKTSNENVHDKSKEFSSPGTATKNGNKLTKRRRRQTQSISSHSERDRQFALRRRKDTTRTGCSLDSIRKKKTEHLCHHLDKLNDRVHYPLIAEEKESINYTINGGEKEHNIITTEGQNMRTEKVSVQRDELHFTTEGKNITIENQNITTEETEQAISTNKETEEYIINSDSDKTITTEENKEAIIIPQEFEQAMITKENNHSITSERLGTITLIEENEDSTTLEDNAQTVITVSAQSETTRNVINEDSQGKDCVKQKSDISNENVHTIRSKDLSHSRTTTISNETKHTISTTITKRKNLRSMSSHSERDREFALRRRMILNKIRKTKTINRTDNK